MSRAAISGQQINVQVFPPYRKVASVRWLRKIALQALIQGQSAGKERPPRYHSLSLTIAGDETVRKLNRDYRGLDETTDVLAFAFDYPGEYQGHGTPPEAPDDVPFITAPDDEEQGFAGEVIVSLPQCRRQAEARGHAASDELALLVVHGVLHLLGYDHAMPKEERAMHKEERRALEALRTQGIRAFTPAARG